MVFKAKGKLTQINPTNGWFEAIMHEGFLGSNHPIQIHMDRRFVGDVLKRIHYMDVKLGNKPILSEDGFRPKDVEKHEIIIIIK